MADRPIWVAHLFVEAVAATTRYVLIDLSDTTNYPHALTNELHILGFHLSLEKATDGAFDIYIGAITEVDASNGTADWIYAIHNESVANPTDSADAKNLCCDATLGGRNPEGWNLVVVGGVLTHLITNSQEAANAGWQTDVGLASPAGAAGGATGKPGVGDLVMKIEETAGSGTIDFSMTVLYEVG